LNNSQDTLNPLNKKTAPIQDNYVGLEYPIKVLQIGEGNFLRGFCDWMIHQCNKKGYFQGSIAVTQPRPAGKEKIDKLKEQDGLYILLTRGVENGDRVTSSEVISVFSQVINPYEEWNTFLELAANPTLEFVISNTTEAGLNYQPTLLEEGVPIQSFPGKLTLFLYHRYLHFSGNTEKGLTMLPCELLERNGDILKECVLRYSKEWELPEAFIKWLKEHNLFLNSLVDRIVTGFPKGEADSLFKEWGYKDSLLNTAEPYHFWAIEGNSKLDHRLPFKKSGLNVHWVEDLSPYQTRKVRILNGAHTLMALRGILSGMETVKEFMENSNFSHFLHEVIKKEVIPSTQGDFNENIVYAEEVFERFTNPFIHHRLADISLNSLSKFKHRLLPTLKSYVDLNGALPLGIVQAFGALIRFYKTEKLKGIWTGEDFNGYPYILKDEEYVLEFYREQWLQYQENQISLLQLVENVLGNKDFWDENLNRIEDLSNLVHKYLAEILKVQ